MTSADHRPVIASKTTYGVLAVDSGEESEEDEVLDTSLVVDSSSETPAKPTKSALKKAAKLARTEKRRQQKTLAKLRTSSNASPQLDSASPSVSPPGSAVNPLKVLPDVEPVSPSKHPEPEPVVVPPTVESEVAPPVITTEDSISKVHAPAAAEKSKQPPAPTPGELERAIGPVTDTVHLPSKTREATVKRPGPDLPFHEKPSLAEDSEQKKNRQNVLTRTLWTFIMIGGFVGLLLLGHAYMIVLVLLCQTLVYREVTALFSLKPVTTEARAIETKQGKDPWSKTLNWYFFAVTNYFLYGESIIYYFKHVVFADAQLLPFATNHRMISFTLYTIGFMGFVMSLKKGYLKQQFGLFCWVHMSLLLIVVSSHFIVNNILEGLIWFWVPASLVICNDVFAYIWGKTLGRTPLIALSPKKTVEGFVGAFWSTITFGVLWGTYFMRFDYMICPIRNLGVSAWSSCQCVPNPVFVWKELPLWKPVTLFLSTLVGRPVITLPYAPYQLHLLFMSCFASLVAPFGGFFASGFKRAFNIKDFGHSIPGHGGMTDRMDCQFLMGVFTYVYYSSLIREHHVTVGSILQTIVSGLTVDQQLELIADLKRYLSQQGIIIP